MSIYIHLKKKKSLKPNTESLFQRYFGSKHDYTFLKIQIKAFDASSVSTINALLISKGIPKYLLDIKSRYTSLAFNLDWVILQTHVSKFHSKQMESTIIPAYGYIF